MALKIIFMGTPDFAVPALAELLAAGHEICAVYTRAPKAAGRGLNEKLSPVHDFAQKNGLPVFHPASLKNAEEQERLRFIAPDVIIVVAYGLLLPQAILDLPKLGCLNLHASLLPRWRGAAPINRAIMAGDKETGIIVMRMDKGLDTGPIAMSEKITIGETMTAGELHEALAKIGGDLLHRALSALERGALTFTPQDEEGVTYARKIEKTEAKIGWDKPAQDIHNHIRGLSPYPGAWFSYNNERIKVLRSEVVRAQGSAGAALDGELTIACGKDAVRLKTLQRAGKQPMRADEFLRGFPVPAGAQLD
jgi:methionyl-tRNA formyltransferase